MIDSIIFDAEGVVIDTEEIWDHAQEQLLARRALHYDRDRVKPQLTGRSLAEGTAILKEIYGLNDRLAALIEERRQLVGGSLANGTGFMAGFETFFETVRFSYKTALATSMDPALFDSVDRRLRLGELFGGHVVTLPDVDHIGKPAPALFLHAAAILASRPETCLVVEDAPSGVEAARRAGMCVVGLATTHPPEVLGDADLVVASFADFEVGQISG